MSEEKKIVLVSDNHTLLKPIEYLRHTYSSYDYFFHCGDSEFPKKALKDFACVRGNNDDDPEYPLHKIIEVGNHRFLLTHGHRDFFLMKYEMLADLGRREGCDVVCFGHTHVPFQKVIHGVLLLNPGSIWCNRDGTKASYMLLSAGEKIQVELKRYEKST